MAEQWYYTRNKQQQGPVSPEQLRQLAGAGQIGPSDMVWKDGMEKWMPANQIAGLFPGRHTPVTGKQPPPVEQAGPPQPSVSIAPSPVPVTQAMTFLDLDFTRYVTTAIVKWIWRIWLILVGIGLIAGTVSILWQFPVLQAVLALIGLLLMWTLLTLAVRIWLETIAVIFRATEYLRDMNARSERLSHQ